MTRPLADAVDVVDWQDGIPQGIVALVASQSVLVARDVANVSRVCRWWREALPPHAASRLLPAHLNKTRTV
jgi:hypothetical protein